MGGLSSARHSSPLHSSPLLSSSLTMSISKVTYYGITGLGEPIRVAMALAGMPFDDNKVSGPVWKEEIKPNLPVWANIPNAEIATESGSETLFQSRAILRYVGSTGSFEGHKLYPDDPMERYFCDEVIEMVEDVRPLMVPTFAIADEEEKKKARAELIAEGGKMYAGLQKLDARLARFSFAAGENPTIADCYLITVIYMFQQPTFLDGFPEESLAPFTNIVALKNKLMALPPLVEYYKDAEGIRAPFKL